MLDDIEVEFGLKISLAEICTAIAFFHLHNIIFENVIKLGWCIIIDWLKMMMVNLGYMSEIWRLTALMQFFLESNF